ncbi:glycosyltransferase family 4 protein [Alicyclobacillus curvatus]|nr:glycosyltransferase family 4 protein [Alicyclobacillus curvatus]
MGFHFQFVVQSVLRAGLKPAVYSRRDRGYPDAGFTTVHRIPAPSWHRAIPYSPLRWMPSAVVYEDCCRFDREVARLLPTDVSVYHSFPGFAEASFRRVKSLGGTTVLEAATVHVAELYAISEKEHQLRNIRGNAFSRRWTERVIREYELADHITVASRLQFESLVRNGVPASKLIMAPLGVDTKHFYPFASDREDKSGRFRVIQVGQVSLLKGVPYLLDALLALNDPDVELVLLGGVGWRAIRDLIATYVKRGLNIRLEVGDPLPALRTAHVCVHATLSDGFGMAPLEAMATGLPVIVTEQTGMKDLVQSGVNGYIVSAKNSVEIAEKIRDLKGTEMRRLAMGKAARLTAKNYALLGRQDAYAEALSEIWMRARQKQTARLASR